MQIESKHWAIGLAIAAGVALLGWLLWPSAQPVTAFTVTADTLTESVEDEGRTQLRDRYTVAAPIAGFLQRVRPEPGDAVEAGQVLFSLEPSPAPALDSRAREQAAETLRAARARETAAAAQRDNAAAEARFAESEYRRHQQLFERGLISATEREQVLRARDRAVAAERAAEAAREAAFFELEMARAVVDIAEGRRDADAARALSVVAPITGVVLQRQRCCEGPIAAGEPVVTLGHLEDLEVVADVLSADAVRIEPGMGVRLHHWGGEGVLNGEVRRVSPAGFTRTSALGVEEQRVPIHVTLTDPPNQWARLGEGYRVEVEFLLWVGEDVLQVPTSALFRHGQDWHVFVVEQGRARLRPVELGRRSGLRVGIDQGLQRGDVVITHPGDAVVDGARVRIERL